jgi:hypothetical protein
MLIREMGGRKALNTDQSIPEILSVWSEERAGSKKLSRHDLQDHMLNSRNHIYSRQISEEFEKRHFKVGKFRLCFPFSNVSADLSTKINSMAID